MFNLRRQRNNNRVSLKKIEGKKGLKAVINDRSNQQVITA